MTAATVAQTRIQNSGILWKGALAGLAGGLAGYVAKSTVQKLLPPAKPADSTPLPAALFAGAVYGITVEYTAQAKVWQGASFGFALKKLGLGGVLPGVPSAPAASEATAPERLQSWAGNIAFGLAAEATRKYVRQGL